MKQIIKYAVIIFFAVGVCSTLTFSQSADSVIGKWYTEGNDSIVEVYKQGDKYFGKIIWLKDPNDDAGNPVLDDKNPDESKRSRKILGLVIMRNFIFDGSKWAKGKIYDPESGKTYSCQMTLDGNTLNVRGYVGVSALGRTSAWNRVK